MKFKIENVTHDIDIKKLIIAGWTGRNKNNVQHHIDELALLGIEPPTQTPLFYKVSELMVTDKNTIQVLGHDSSGEVEPAILKYNDKLYLGIGSDHTDRKLEAYSVAYSKQISPKPIGNEFWLLDDVIEHIDQLELRSWIYEKNQWILYQNGCFNSILPIVDIINKAGIEEETLILCGTLNAIGGIRTSPRFKMEISDPILNRKISKEYNVYELEEVR